MLQIMATPLSAKACRASSIVSFVILLPFSVYIRIILKKLSKEKTAL